ncbi:MAG TPA: SufD family Fe-S cluster assembly protein [Chlamydiales bacterium]|nr:SufD family Fe-S cluster assembly protein [Chlamydiales bacterium]
MDSELIKQLESDFQVAFARTSSLQEWRKRGWDKFLALQPHSSLRAMPRIASHSEEGKKDFRYLHQLLFVDGFFHSHSLPKQLSAQSLEDAMRSYGLFLQNWFSRSLKEEKDPFAALNIAFHGKGAFLYVPPKVQIPDPIEIHHFFTSSQMAFSNLQVVLGKGASLSLVQRVSSRSEEPFANLRLDVSLDEGATLFLGDDGGWPEGAIRWEASRFVLKKESRLQFLSLTQGSKEGNISLDVQLLEENASALIQGFSHLRKDLSLKVQSTMEHVAPHCHSRQHFKTILEDESRFLFGGKILIRPEAQKTMAYQLNNNLLLSNRAISRAEPHLEIFADDVKASHGATFTSLDDEELFYLRSRGILPEEGKKILVQGFGEEILASSPPFFKRS